MAAKNKSVNMSNQNQGGEMGAFTEDEANKKRLRKENGKLDINEAVETAKRFIIQGRIEDANRLVYDKMTDTIRNKIFGENSIELLPAYFVLAEANICMGTSRLKKAEEFLIAAYWNLLKYTSDENEKGGDSKGAQDDVLVTKEEIERYRASLHKTFGRLFLAQTRQGASKQALEELSKGIYLECSFHGPESIYLCSSYFYMGELFKKEGQVQKAKNFYQKIIQIWKKFIIEKDLGSIEDYNYSAIDRIHYEEAHEHLKNILVFFEIEFGPQDVLTAECQFAFGLVLFKNENKEASIDLMTKAHIIYSNTLGEFDRKTKEVEQIIKKIQSMYNGGFKEKFLEYASTRKGLSVVSWAIGFSLILILSVTVAPINKTCELAFFVVSTFTLSICALITIFARYIDEEKFPVSAIINIGMTYFFSFASIGILSIDLGFTLNNKYHNDLEEQQKHSLFLSILWNFIYWGSLFHGTVMAKFFSKYWQSGHFSRCGRIKHSLKQLFILIVGGSIVFVILGISIYSKFGFYGLNGVKAAALIMSNVYSMLVLVVLLAYGLFNLPVFLWKYADNKHKLYQELENAESCRKEYRQAMADFQTFVIQCRNLISNYRSGHNTGYMDILEEELPQKDLEGQSIISSGFTMDLKKNQEVDENFLANIRYQMKVSFFLYKRKKAKWYSMFEKVDSLVQKPIQFEQAKTISLNNSKNKPTENVIHLDDMVLKPCENNPKKIWTYRILSIISLLFCILVIVTEGTIVVDHPNLIIINIVFTLVYLSCITLVCFFTIFNLKLSDYLQLVPHHTDCVTFSSITGMCCKIITVSCFNYMVILGEVAIGKDLDPFGTSYVDFYSSMIKVPVFGQYFNKIMPLFILVFGGVFALMSFFKYQNKALAAFKNYSKKVEKQMQKLNKLEKEEGIKKDVDIKDISASEYGIIENILKGEKAILAEYEIIRRKEQRNKIGMFNLGSDNNKDIEMQNNNSNNNTKKKDSGNKVTNDINKSNNNKSNISDISDNTKKKKVNKKGFDPKDEKSKPLLENKKKSNNLRSSSSDSVSDNSNVAVTAPANKNQGNIRSSRQFTTTQPVRKIQYGIFRKAKITEEEEIREEDHSDSHQTKKQPKTKGFQKQKQNHKQQPSESDSEESGEESIEHQMIRNPLAGNKNKFGSSGGDFRSKFEERRSKLKQDEHNKKNQPKTKFSKKGAAIPTKTKDSNKEGYLLKRKGKRIRKIWVKRYGAIEGSKLRFYDNEDKDQIIKTIDLAKIKQIAFHYDEDAPVQSKKINNKEKEESRFDLYSNKDGKEYKFKTEDDNVWESQAWVEALKDVAREHNPNYTSS